MRPAGEGIGGGWSLRAGLGFYGLPGPVPWLPRAPAQSLPVKQPSHPQGCCPEAPVRAPAVCSLLLPGGKPRKRAGPALGVLRQLLGERAVGQRL